jgi:hypothetical protein
MVPAIPYTEQNELEVFTITVVILIMQRYDDKK